MAGEVYSYKEVKARVSCLDYLARIGVRVSGAGRCKAKWRGGTHDSVHVEADKWYDFVERRGGSVVDLCAEAECGGDATRAVRRLAEMFGVAPVAVAAERPRRTRAQFLLASGYRETAAYDYTDAEGRVVYTVARFEKDAYAPGEKKEFVQRTPLHEGLDPDTPRLPYNLPEVVKAARVFVVEGEKDVETLRAAGIVATTSSGGAGARWDEAFAGWFRGKDVVVLPDNDGPGRAHGEAVAAALAPVARSVRTLALSALPKGDVTDWMEREGGTAERLLALADAAPAAAPAPANAAKEAAALAVARRANAVAFRNYVSVGSGKGGERHVPVSMRELVKECHERFLGFPKRIGETLFDLDRGTKRVEFLCTADAVFAWMAIKSGRNVDFEGGPAFAGRREFAEALRQSAEPFSSVSPAPHFPARSDVFYTHGPLPEPDPSHASFWRLVSFFSPAGPAHRTILAAFLFAPLFYEPGADRPLWVVDTADQQGSGKTSLVKLCALLYGEEYAAVDLGQLDRDVQQVRRRLVSPSARAKRIVVFDNVTRTVASSNLASLVTESSITGLAPYGRTEETRPNDLTYVVTANNATLSDDIASRAYIVRLRRPEDPLPTWFSDVASYVEANRLQIFADMIHMAKTNPLASSSVRRSRFGRFDQAVLSAVCRSEAEYAAADAELLREAADMNTDADRGTEFADLFAETMRARADPLLAERARLRVASASELARLVDLSAPVFISSADVDWMLANSDGELRTWKCRDVLGLVRNGHVPQFDRDAQRLDTKDRTCFDGSPLRRLRGLLYRPDPRAGIYFAQVVRRAGGVFSVVARARFRLGVGKASAARGRWGAEVGAVAETRTETRTVTETTTVTETRAAASAGAEAFADEGPDPSGMF